jgi:hypothetical protein
MVLGFARQCFSKAVRFLVLGARILRARIQIMSFSIELTDVLYVAPVQKLVQRGRSSLQEIWF